MSGTFDNEYNGYPLVATLMTTSKRFKDARQHLESSLADIEAFPEENRQEIKDSVERQRLTMLKSSSIRMKNSAT